MALHYLSQLIDFFKEAGKYTSPDEDAVARAGPEAPLYVSFHERVVTVSVIFGLIGAVLGVGMIVREKSGNDALPRITILRVASL